jgi:serine/threonine protein phosphatase PrpC
VITAAVADGVSMCYQGEVASYNTVRYIMNWTAEYFTKNDFQMEQVLGEFERLINSINQSLNTYIVNKKKKSMPEGYSPYSSCTLCCMITDGHDAVFFSVGDSAIFELKPYHTNPIMNDADAKRQTDTMGRLTSYIGGIESNAITISYKVKAYDPSAVYILCTDGMTGHLTIDWDQSEPFKFFNQRLFTVTSKEMGYTVLQGMTDYVVSQGETDDITALVIKNI